MPMRPKATRALALMLIVGTVLLGAGAALHPVLPSHPAGQLQVIAATPAWAGIHLAMVVGSGLVIAGLWSRLAVEETDNRIPLAVFLLVIAVGVGCNTVNIFFMEHRGMTDASRFAAGDTSVIAPYMRGHLQSLTFAGVGNQLVAVGCLGLGWAEWTNPARPRWIAWLAWLAGIGGLLGVLLFEPTSRGAVAAVALLSAWALGSAALAWWPSGAPSGASDDDQSRATPAS